MESQLLCIKYTNDMQYKKRALMPHANSEAQISLHIHGVWSGLTLFHILQNLELLYMDNEVPHQTAGPSCSKLTTSLVNDWLKFISSDTQIC